MFYFIVFLRQISLLLLLLHVCVTVSEVEEGDVYQIEDVWDGTQWHKSKKTLPNEAGDAQGLLM